MARKIRVVAVFIFADRVSDFIGDALAFIESLTTPPGNTKVIVPAGVITNLETKLDELAQAQAKVDSGEDGMAAGRDVIWDQAEDIVRDLERIVQKAVDDAPNEAEGIAIVQAVGLHVKAKGVFLKPDIAVKRDKLVFGLLHLISKAAGPSTHAAYEWQKSDDGNTWETIKISTKSRTTYMSNVTAGTKIYFRKRVITVDLPSPPDWSQVVFIFVI